MDNLNVGLRDNANVDNAKVKARHDGKIASMSVARQLARRSYHVLRAVDPELVYSIPA